MALWLAALPVATIDAQSAKAPTVAEWRADLKYLDATIRSVHPAPFHRVAEGDFAKAVGQLDRALPTLSPQKIVVRFAAIVALLNDGHSRLALDNPITAHGQAFPMRLDRFADGIHAVAVTPDARQLLGLRLVRIGSLNAEAAWDSLAGIASGDNIFSRWAAVPYLVTVPGVLEGLGLSSGDSLTLAGVTDHGDTVRLTIHAQAAGQDRRWFSEGWTGPAGATVTMAPSGDRAPLSERHRDETYWYTVEGHQLYAQVNAVQNAADAVHLGDQMEKTSFGGFTDRVLARLDSGGIDRMVLDLRYNDGGNNDLVRGMVAGLAARPAINQRGILFVVTGRTTYSAAMNFTSLLEDRTAALFVGESPGGSPRHYGDAVNFTLPNSHLGFRVSTLRWEIGVRPTDIRQVMEPDLPAPPTASALAAGRDPAMEAIEGYSRQPALADRLLDAYKAGGLAAARDVYTLSVRTEGRPAPWNGNTQQLVNFAYSTFGVAKSRQDVMDVFAWITEAAPLSVESRSAQARACMFIRDWKGFRTAIGRARALDPNNELLRRFEAMAERQG